MLQTLYAAMSIGTIVVELYLAFALLHGGARYHAVAVASGVALHVAFALSGFLIGQFSWMMVSTFVALMRDRHSPLMLRRWRAFVRACEARLASLSSWSSSTSSSSSSPSSPASSFAVTIIVGLASLVGGDVLLTRIVTLPLGASTIMRVACASLLALAIVECALVVERRRRRFARLVSRHCVLL
jgi:hypothetical protein